MACFERKFLSNNVFFNLSLSYSSIHLILNPFNTQDITSSTTISSNFGAPNSTGRPSLNLTTHQHVNVFVILVLRQMQRAIMLKNMM